MRQYNYLSKENTTAVNGIFILVVFLSHLREYVTLPQILQGFTSSLGQLMVAMFLFYSGYGVMESIKKKGIEYVREIPLKRVGKVLFSFDIAVLVFAVLNILLEIPFTLPKFLLSLVGWESLGNSNWYIFVVLCLYFITWLSFMIGKDKRWVSFCFLVVFSVILFFILYETKESWWYNTLTAYPFGVFFSLTKEKWDKYLSKNIVWLPVAVGSVFVTVILRPQSWHFYVYLLMTITYCLFIICITKKVPVYNPVLYWLGGHLFEIYILMRIPMIVLKRIQVPILHTPLVFGLVSLVITLLMAAGFHWFLQRKITFRKE